VHLCMIFVNNQIDAQFVMYVYFYFVHVSGSQVPIIRRIIVPMRHLVYVTPCRWPSGMQEHMVLHTRRSSARSDINQVSHWYNNSPDDGHLAARNMYKIETNIHEKLCVNLVICKDKINSYFGPEAPRFSAISVSGGLTPCILNFYCG